MRNSTPLWFMERDITTFENSLDAIFKATTSPGGTLDVDAGLRGSRGPRGQPVTEVVATLKARIEQLEAELAAEQQRSAGHRADYERERERAERADQVVNHPGPSARRACAAAGDPRNLVPQARELSSFIRLYPSTGSALCAYQHNINPNETWHYIFAPAPAPHQQNQ